MTEPQVIIPKGDYDLLIKYKKAYVDKDEKFIVEMLTKEVTEEVTTKLRWKKELQDVKLRDARSNAKQYAQEIGILREELVVERNPSIYKWAWVMYSYICGLLFSLWALHQLAKLIYRSL